MLFVVTEWRLMAFIYSGIAPDLKEILGVRNAPIILEYI